MLLAAATIALSAFLLFLVQPIIAKQILPWFGGTSAVWTVCMVFFQMLLLGGYTYAHLLTRQPARRQALVHIGLLLASLLFLPIIPREFFKPAGEEDAALRILLLLAATIGLPYFLLSSTGPLLQKWVAHRFPQKTVYRLFALSNAGSLVGLLVFPFLIEPFAPSRLQSWAWTIAYLVFVGACSVTAWRARSLELPGAAPASHSSEPPPGPADYGLWLALAALGSVLLLAVTSHITQNVASVPFLWVVPLTLYLLTFVLAFEGRGGRGFYSREWWWLPVLFAVVTMAWGLSASNGVLDIGVAVPLYCIGLFLACMFCHGELAHHKPAPRYLTQFYLMVSLGGALGGLFVGLVAPRIFSGYYELPLALFALAALACWLALGARSLIGPAIVATIATAYSGWAYYDFLRRDTVVMQRSFYGTLRVRETGRDDRQVRRLLHGVILHGEQFTRGPERLEPGTYYARTSGIGRAIESKYDKGPLRLGLVGLGVGTLSTYGRAGDVVRFYELDPHVLQVARAQFSYLNEARARLEFELGDARLSLERELNEGRRQQFDVLAIDAFSSDAIPVHLLTREAMALYTQHMAAAGIIAVHISNRFLDLKPVLGNLADAVGLYARLVSDAESDGASGTDWVLLARDPAVFDAPQLAALAELLPAAPGYSLWTDQFNNLIDVLKARPLEGLRALLPG